MHTAALTVQRATGPIKIPKHPKHIKKQFQNHSGPASEAAARIGDVKRQNDAVRENKTVKLANLEVFPLDVPVFVFTYAWTRHAQALRSVPNKAMNPDSNASASLPSFLLNFLSGDTLTESSNLLPTILTNA